MTKRNKIKKMKQQHAAAAESNKLKVEEREKREGKSMKY